MTRLPRVVVILAGGEGRRLWPASTPRRPKQFLRLFGGKSLLEATWERARAVPGVDDVWVVTGDAYAGLTRQVLPELRPDRLVVEPSGKNTAPALALVAGHIARACGDAAVLVLPADHYIPDHAAFAAAAGRALAVAESGEALVTFGIQPTRPETNYGYMELEEPAGPGRAGAGGGGAGAGGEPGEVAMVRRFVEKPDAERAAAFLAAGNYVWNSGMFAWRNGLFLAELERCVPELAELARRVAAGGDWRAAWEEAPSISVDYAVMERARRIACVRARFAWDDLGSWLAVERHGEPDENGNVVVGSGPVALRDTRGTTVLAEDLPAAVLGVRDLVVAATREGVLVAAKERLDGLRDALAALEAARAGAAGGAGS